MSMQGNIVVLDDAARGVVGDTFWRQGLYQLVLQGGGAYSEWLDPVVRACQLSARLELFHLGRQQGIAGFRVSVSPLVGAERRWNAPGPLIKSQQKAMGDAY